MKDNPLIRVMIAGLKTGGQGLNLVWANVVLHGYVFLRHTLL